LPRLIGKLREKTVTEALKIERSNPVDEMLSDEEVIEYFLDCCREDREGLTLARAMAFAVQSLGEARTAKLMIPAGLNNPRVKARGFLREIL
jgi:hypothetical protein